MNELPTEHDLTEPDATVAQIKDDLIRAGSTRNERVAMKFLMAALGAIPWVGGLIGAAVGLSGDEKANRSDDLRTQWLEEHHRKLVLLKRTLDDINARFSALGSDITERIQSEEYLALVRQSFRAWDRAETEAKRKYVATLLTNAAGTGLVSDDVLRLFITWLDLYHEAHFALIREIFASPGSTRYEIWTKLYGATPREDSAEADLYKLLFRDLSTGGVIRQPRDTTEEGEFLRNRVRSRRGAAPRTMESAFEDTKPYVLTELGKQFVHYTMNEVVPRLSSEPSQNGQAEGGGAQ